MLVDEVDDLQRQRAHGGQHDLLSLDLGIARLKQQQGRQHAAQAAVAVLERVDLQQHDHEDGDDQQGMPLRWIVCLLALRILIHAVNSAIRRGVAKGVAVSNTVPIFAPVSSKAATLLEPAL